MSQQAVLNRFLVDSFNIVLRTEARALCAPPYENLSVNEFHVIEAAGKAGEHTMSALSRLLGITMGSLTVAVKTLEKKGYLLRQRASGDRRLVQVVLTPLGEQANAHHAAFHQRMTQAVMDQLDEKQLEVLTKTLSIIEDFFEIHSEDGAADTTD